MDNIVDTTDVTQLPDAEINRLVEAALGSADPSVAVQEVGCALRHDPLIRGVPRSRIVMAAVRSGPLMEHAATVLSRTGRLDHFIAVLPGWQMFALGLYGTTLLPVAAPLLEDEKYDWHELGLPIQANPGEGSPALKGARKGFICVEKGEGRPWHRSVNGVILVDRTQRTVMSLGRRGPGETVWSREYNLQALADVGRGWGGAPYWECDPRKPGNLATRVFRAAMSNIATLG